MKDGFRKFSVKVAACVGSPITFVVSLTAILIWAVTGPIFHFSNTWQLVVNTVTTVITFLMVFLIQNTQNRDTLMINLKLDELLRAVEGARTGLVNLDRLSDEDLAQLHKEFIRLGKNNPCLMPLDPGDLPGQKVTKVGSHASQTESGSI